MVSVFEIYNYLFLSLYVISMPCYAIAKLSDNGLWGGLLYKMGELIDGIWFPGTRVIRAAGESGVQRFVPGSKRQILKSVCVMCPPTVETLQKSKAAPSDSDAAAKFNTEPTRRLRYCVRTGLGEAKPNSLVVFKGPKAMHPEEYVYYQLFGSEWSNTIRMLKLKQQVFAKDMIDLPYNKEMFQQGTPFVWSRLAVHLDKNSAFPPGDITPAVLGALSKGYYMVGTLPFVPPKMWTVHTSELSGKPTASSDPFYFKGSGGPTTFPASYTKSTHTEYDYWFNDQHGTDMSNCLNWTPEQFAYYAQAFFSNVDGPMKFHKFEI